MKICCVWQSGCGLRCAGRLVTNGPRIHVEASLRKRVAWWACYFIIETDETPWLIFITVKRSTIGCALGKDRDRDRDKYQYDAQKWRHVQRSSKTLPALCILIWRHDSLLVSKIRGSENRKSAYHTNPVYCVVPWYHCLGWLGRVVRCRYSSWSDLIILVPTWKHTWSDPKVVERIRIVFQRSQAPRMRDDSLYCLRIRCKHWHLVSRCNCGSRLQAAIR